MNRKNQNSYDVIIIGAGIGGLVCGCYLAKAGMKVLIIEQHNKPGGYCTSFKRKRYLFDAAPHCFGSFRKDGITRTIFNELGIKSKLNIIRSNPSDIIVTPDYEIPFWNDLEETINYMESVFCDKSKNIRKFFNILKDSDPNSFSQLRTTTFGDLLNHYFDNEKLKAILSLPLLSIAGLPSSMISAFVAAKLYSEFIFDGGYYPANGMQALPDTLARQFKDYGGKLRLSCRAKRIRIKNKEVKGIVLDHDEYIPSKYVISNCDARQTFLKLIGKDNIEQSFLDKLKNMKPSLSTFIVYLGLDKSFRSIHNPGTFYMCFSDYDSENAYNAAQNADLNGYGGFNIRFSHNYSTAFVGMSTSFKNKQFWKNNKTKLMNSLINKIEFFSIPNLSSHIIHKEAATPHTLHRYTLNYKGASYGWANIPSQFGLYEYRKPKFLKNFFLTGHWTTLGVGISGTAYVGYDTAKMVLRNARI